MNDTPGGAASDGRAPEPEPGAYCLDETTTRALARPPWGTTPPPWAPGRRETPTLIERAVRMTDPELPDSPTWCIADVDILRDLNDQEMEALAAAAPMKTYTTGELLYSPHQPSETLFMLRAGRVRLFRVSADGRALTTAILEPGTIFGEMVLLGQRMHDNFAEALDDVIVCVMSRTDVRRLLLADARIATRITELLGQRLTDIEQRLTDTVFKSVPQRVATTLVTLAADTSRRGPLGPRKPEIRLTHQQIAALAGTTRETTTKVLRDLADRGLLRLARGRIVILDPVRLGDETG
ncbi:Crp/Fnr family transcriptional regulator [Streptacidiphilus sp. MAP12-20]|uniref:Crp/Fnr family transcriptional regulator n=1 Tax=Streptacidiphilus sp. MAP12-20 TaxID=3156299 RepID=UPI0035134024